MRSFRLFAQRHALWVGFLLIFLCTWSIDLTLALQVRGWLPNIIPPALGIFVGYGFVIAAILATFLVDGFPGIAALLRRYLIWRVGTVWYGVVLLGPVFIVLLALALAWFAGGSIPDFTQPLVRQIPGIPPISLVWLALIWMLFEILTNGEEIGWRGYILPRLLARYNALVASLILGVIWALWHLPQFGMGGLQAEARQYPFWVFGVLIISQTILFTWVFQHTRGSLLIATLFHAAINTAPMLLPLKSGELAFYIAIALYCLCAIVVVTLTGPHLQRPIPLLGASDEPDAPIPLS